MMFPMADLIKLTSTLKNKSYIYRAGTPKNHTIYIYNIQNFMSIHT